MRHEVSSAGAAWLPAIPSAGIAGNSILDRPTLAIRKLRGTSRTAEGRCRDQPPRPLGRSAAPGAGQPGGRAQARLRDYPRCCRDHGRAADRRHALRRDRAPGGRRADRAARLDRPAPPVPDHRGRARRPGRADGPDGPDRVTRSGPPGYRLWLGRRVSRPGPGLLTGLALMLYPPAWRDRYADEVRALLEDSGAGAAAAASLAVRAVPAWVSPHRHLHDREARMRASVGTVLVAWSALTGLGLVFAQLTQLQGFMAAGHPLVQRCCLIFDAALAVSALTAAAGGLPVWLQMIRVAREQRRRRELAWLSLAIVVPAAYLAAALITLMSVHHPEGSGPWLFAGFAVLGFGAAGLASAGQAVALKRLAPAGPAVTLAVVAAGVAAAAIALAG